MLALAHENVSRETGGLGIATVQPFAVVTEVPADDPRSGTGPRNAWIPGRIEGLVFAPDAVAAVLCQIYHRHRVRKKRDRLALAKTFPPAVPLWPFRLRAADAPRAIGMPVYAPSVAAATVLATAEHGTDGYAESCDDLDVIHALEEKELWRQVRYVWTEDFMRYRTPGIFRRWTRWGATGWYRDSQSTPEERMRPTVRNEACYALRLAMLIPWFGTRPSSEIDTGGSIMDRTWGRRRAHARHDDNIPKRVTDDMFDRFGERLVPFSQGDTMLLERFLRAYGLNGEGMTWREIAGLWEGGPEGATRARLDHALGSGEVFSHGPAYRH